MELDAYSIDDKTLLINPKIISKTLEIERSVIKIVIDHSEKTYNIESEIPEINGKGPKPTLDKERYLKSISKPEFSDLIRNFWNDWKNIGGDIKFHTASFSAGINYNGKRTPIFYGYLDNTPVISEKTAEYYNIPKDQYNIYKEELMASSTVYDEFVIGNKVGVPFDRITNDELSLIMKASLQLALNILNINK
jgi:hypothetical protein